jgi:hypothetical protein
MTLKSRRARTLIVAALGLGLMGSLSACVAEPGALPASTPAAPAVNAPVPTPTQTLTPAQVKANAEAAATAKTRASLIKKIESAPNGSTVSKSLYGIVPYPAENNGDWVYRTLNNSYIKVRRLQPDPMSKSGQTEIAPLPKVVLDDLQARAALIPAASLADGGAASDAALHALNEKMLNEAGEYDAEYDHMYNLVVILQSVVRPNPYNPATIIAWQHRGTISDTPSDGAYSSSRAEIVSDAEALIKSSGNPNAHPILYGQGGK